MTAKAQRAYVQRQKEQDPEGWAARQAAHERNRYKRRPDRKQPLVDQDPEKYAELARQARASWNQRPTPAQIDQCIAQARKWASHPDNGWAPTREQVTVLADEVERLRAAVDDAWSDGYNEGHSDSHTSASEGTT